MKQEEKHFWKVVIPIWIAEISIWTIAFGRNVPIGYVIAFFLAMVANAFLHKFGIKMTEIIHGPKDKDLVFDHYESAQDVHYKHRRVLVIATKGVWGCDMIQSIVILVAYLIHKFVF